MMVAQENNLSIDNFLKLPINLAYTLIFGSANISSEKVYQNEKLIEDQKRKNRK